jgi:hypothetical protein
MDKRWAGVADRTMKILQKAHPRKYRENRITIRFMTWREIEAEADGRRSSLTAHGWADQENMRAYLDREYLAGMSENFAVYVAVHEALHLYFKNWGEKRVDFRAMDLIKDYGGANLEALYKELLRREKIPLQITLEESVIRMERKLRCREET